MFKAVGFVAAVAVVGSLLSSAPAVADGECKQCIKEKLDPVGAKVALGALVGAAGGAAGLLPGAACGAILGATGVALESLVEVAQCADTCTKEAKARNDKSASKCTDLMTKVQKK